MNRAASEASGLPAAVLPGAVLSSAGARAGAVAWPNSARPGLSLAGPHACRDSVSGSPRTQTLLARLALCALVLAGWPLAHGQGVVSPAVTGSPATGSPVIGSPVTLVTLPPVPSTSQGASFVTVGGLTVREVRFDLSGSDYPPARFPAVYTPVFPVGGNLALRPGTPGGPWDLLMRVLPFGSSVATGTTPAGSAVQAGGEIRTDQLEYRVLIDNPSPAQAATVPWLPAFSEQVVVQVQSDVPERYVVQLRLRVEGHEQAGVQDTTVLFTLRPLGR